MSKGIKAIFLDRDGTINIDKNYLYKKEDFEYMPGATVALKKLYDAGYALIIITNQSGIARGLYLEEEYLELDSWLKDDLKARGIVISASYYCPHHPNALVEKYKCQCDCRKPKTGLYWEAQHDLNIDMDQSYAIGDKLRDLAICNESGVSGILLDNNEIITNNTSGIVVCSNWDEIIKHILFNSNLNNI